MRNLKKVIALVAVFAMLVTSVAFAQTYSDVKDDDNYAEAIEMLSNLGILTGDDQDGDGVMDFRPNDTITRAEVAAIVCRIQDLNNLAQTATQFDDVTSENWASGYINQAAGQGIINGNGDGTFDPEGNVKYEQAVKMFVRTLGYEPYVNANGGYPSGDLAAANRYGVLDGVVGGGTGVDATRGQIAQMAFNALDTPLMDRYSYGTEENFQIYDGKSNREFSTLLTRDLGVKKFTGIVTANQATSIDSANAIDTDEAATVEIEVAAADKVSGAYSDYNNYAVKEVKKIYEADTNASEYLGYEVSVYVKEATKAGEYNLIAVAPTNKNKVASFTIDQFASVSGSKVQYYKNENDNTTTSLTVDADLLAADEATKGILFNGVAYGGTETTLAGILGELKVTNPSTYSGKVTFIDNDSTNGYDVVSVEVAASAVVDEVKSSGKITFNGVVRNALNEKIDLVVDEDDKTTVVKFTKNGEAIEYTDLNEWDVLTVLWNNAGKFYDVRVIDGTKIDGSIATRRSSTTSADGQKYEIGGVEYEVANGCYGMKTGGWSVGASGMFYIDEFGKIVAYDKNGSATVSATAGNYGYVLNAKVVNNSFSESTVRTLILAKDGNVYQADVASKVKVDNGAGTLASDSTLTTKNVASALASAMMNQLITWESNSAGEVKTVTFPEASSVDDAVFTKEGAGTNNDFDEDDMTLKGDAGNYDVTDETIVFFIKGDGAAISGLGDTTNAASKTTSKVTNAASIAGFKKKSVAVYDEEDGIASAVVVFNFGGGISASSNIAVVDEVGDANDEDGNRVFVVKYFMNGEEKVSYTSNDIDVTNGTLNKTTARGTVFKFSVSADNKITAAEKYATLTRGTGLNDGLTVAGLDSRFTANKFGAADTSADEAMYFGPVFDYLSSSKRIRIASTSTTSGVYDFTDLANIKATNANVYVIDVAKKNGKITVGDASDVEYDKDLIERAKKVKDGTTADPTDDLAVKLNGSAFGTVDYDEQGAGLMDFVYAVEYNGDILDVIIYKSVENYKY